MLNSKNGLVIVQTVTGELHGQYSMICHSHVLYLLSTLKHEDEVSALLPIFSDTTNKQTKNYEMKESHNIKSLSSSQSCILFTQCPDPGSQSECPSTYFLS